MSKYTTEVRYICETAYGLTDSKGYDNIEEIIDNVLCDVFDFSFPIFDERYRPVLEKKILKHYYTREISEETVGLWKLRLSTKLNEIMPYYNKLYESELIKIDPISTYARRTERDTKGNVEGTNDNTTKTKTTDENVNKYSDTPQGSLQNIYNDSYLTNATVNNNENNSNGTSNTVFANNSTEKFLEMVTGYDGIASSELLMKYRNSFINIDVMIINELSDLFFNLW